MLLATTGSNLILLPKNQVVYDKSEGCCYTSSHLVNVHLIQDQTDSFYFQHLHRAVFDDCHILDCSELSSSIVFLYGRNRKNELIYLIFVRPSFCMRQKLQRGLVIDNNSFLAAGVGGVLEKASHDDTIKLFDQEIKHMLKVKCSSPISRLCSFTYYNGNGEIFFQSYHSTMLRDPEVVELGNQGEFFMKIL